MPSFHSISTWKSPRAREAANLASVPGLRQRGQQFEHRLAVGRGFLALEQHFCHGRATAEIAVDLERRMETKQVRRSPANEHGEERVGTVAVVQPGPEIGLPRHAPAGRGVAASFQRQAGATVEFGRAGVDFAPRAQAPKMGDMAVMNVRLLKILLPFQDAAILGYTGWREFGSGGVEALGEFIVNPQNPCGGGRVL